MILKFLLTSVAITVALPFALIASQPAGDPPVGDSLDFPSAGVSAPVAPPETYTARDGTRQGLRRYASGRVDAPLVVMIHGSGWHGLQFHALATRVAELGVADVLVPDLRGHGANPARRGDVGYIGQFEDDLADLIAAERRPGQRLVALGHSSGGGLVTRFAGGEHGAMLDAALLLAPFLRHDAPPMVNGQGRWAAPLTRRIVGLTMLNAVGIRALDGLTAIQFRFPASVLDGPLGHTATRAYSYRLNTGFAPRGDALGDIASLPRFILLAGTADQAFAARDYAPYMAAVTDKGSYRLIDGVGHIELVDRDEVIDALRELAAPA